MTVTSMLNSFPISTSAEYGGSSFDVNIKPLQINGEGNGIKTGIEAYSLQGKFRLMNGRVYRVVDDEPPTSGLLKLSEKIKNLEKDGGGNP